VTEIYIVRHGNTFDKGDIVTRVGARTDLPLSSSGEMQAAQLAIHMQEELPDGFAKAHCSPLLRTRQTAAAILGIFESGPELESLEFLREIDYGPDENRPEEDVVARIGEAALKSWDETAVPPPGWAVDPEQVKRDWAALIARLASDQSSSPILVVTSNGIARFVLDAVTAYDTQPDSIKLKTGAYGVLRATTDAVTLLNWNVRP